MEIKPDMKRFDSFKSKYSVKERIFIYYMIFFAFFSVVTIITNIISNLDFSYNYKWMGIFVFSSILSILAHKKIKTGLIHRIGVYIITLVVLPLSWLTSSGLVSPTIIYSIVVMLLINFMLTGIERFVINAINLLLNLGLITFFYKSPQFFKQMSASEQFNDWIFNIPVLFIIIALFLIIFERAYEQERITNINKTKELEILSTTDPLTGIKNRLTLMDDINYQIEKFKENKSIFSIIILDIDYFKKFNDTYGHLQGDICLKTISRILQLSTQDKNSQVYRFGGEEFLIILPKTNENEAMNFAQRLKRKIKNYSIPNEKSEVASVITVSMGISSYTNKEINSDDLLRYADKALYNAKTSGRDEISSYKK